MMRIEDDSNDCGCAPLSSLKPSILLTLVGESFSSCSTTECATDLEYRVTHLMADLPGKKVQEESFLFRENQKWGLAAIPSVLTANMECLREQEVGFND